MAILPMTKLIYLFIRQVSRPMSNKIIRYATTHPRFRSYLTRPAQVYNWCEVKMKMWVMNLGKPVEIPKLNEAMAIELGANLLGETIIFSIAALLLFLEYSRQARKEAAKEAARIEELTNITTAIRDLVDQAEKQDIKLREVIRHIANIDYKISKKESKSG
uniref:OPA3-like protein CG13603 n=1 Tax=Lygus hesperus TaxID=30085 RepID=A0A0A9ZE59_LYGHE